MTLSHKLSETTRLHVHHHRHYCEHRDHPDDVLLADLTQLEASM